MEKKERPYRNTYFRTTLTKRLYISNKNVNAKSNKKQFHYTCVKRQVLLACHNHHISYGSYFSQHSSQRLLPGSKMEDFPKTLTKFSSLRFLSSAIGAVIGCRGLCIFWFGNPRNLKSCLKLPSCNIFWKML